jgi:uncharacterized RmlC-like cupin family protein
MTNQPLEQQMIAAPTWDNDSVKIMRGEDMAASATGGRATAFEFGGSGGAGTWIGTVFLAGGASTGPHHHGRHEVAVRVIRGRSEIRWGAHLEYAAEIGPGDFAYFTPYVPHQELNLDPDVQLEFMVVRSDGEAIRVDLPIVPTETPTPST